MKVVSEGIAVMKWTWVRQVVEETNEKKRYKVDHNSDGYIHWTRDYPSHE